MSSFTQKNFVPGTWRGTRKAHKVPSTMRNADRGNRIKNLRLAKRVTQPAVAHAVHVTLRAYQAWESGGGMNPENVLALAKYFEVEPDYLDYGVRIGFPAISDTPLLPADGGRDPFEELAAMLAVLEDQVRQLRAEMVVRDAEVLGRIEAGFETIQRSLPQRRR